MKVTKLVADAQVKKTETPAQYVTMERQVVDTPATVVTDVVPAKYETIQKQVMTAPEQKRRVEVPAKYETVTKTTLDQPARLVWRKQRCDCGEIVKKYKEVPGTDEATLLMLAK